MTMTDGVDLVSPTLRRERVVDWRAPGPVAKAPMGMSGMETMARDPRRYPAAAADGRTDRLGCATSKPGGS